MKQFLLAIITWSGLSLVFYGTWLLLGNAGFYIIGGTLLIAVSVMIENSLNK